MSGHTPGPWRAEPADMFGDHNIIPPHESAAVAAVVSNLREPAEVAANARLIAAAPDLLEVLEYLRDLPFSQLGLAGPWARVTAAIALATGGSSNDA